MTMLRRTDKSVLSTWWWTVDRPTFISCIILILLGVFLVSAASPPVASRLGLDPYHFVIRHMVFVFPCFAALMFFSLLNPRWLFRINTIILMCGLALMVLVLFIGGEIKGAQRWIQIFGFSIQPSEFVKPAFVFLTAWLIAGERADNTTIPGYTMAGCLYLFFIALLLLQPDFGMAFVMTCVFGAQVFIAGVPIRWIVLLVFCIILGLFSAYWTFDHVKSRIDRFMDPETGNTYQIEKSLEAFQQGGLFGTGPGQGNVKLLLPDSHADFIFSVAGEELGLIFIFMLLGIYAFIVLRGLRRLSSSQDLPVTLAASGLLVLFGLQSFIHMGSSLNVLPTKGMTLPFISYGGSSLISTAIVMGTVLSLTRRYGAFTIKRGMPTWSAG